MHEKKVEAIFTYTLRAWLAEKGFDPLMGARPMARLIQDTIRSALADELLFGKLLHGGRVTIDLDENAIAYYATTDVYTGDGMTLEDWVIDGDWTGNISTAKQLAEDFDNR